jgi:hypothetical protein
MVGKRFWSEKRDEILRAAPRLARLFGFVRNHRDAVLLAAIGGVACVITIQVMSPGYLTTDSAGQLDDARKFRLVDHHPIAMSLLWHYIDRVVPGPLGMLILDSVLYWFGLTAIFATLRWPLWLRALAIPALGFFPPVFCIVGVIWKDTLMQGALVAAVGSFLIFDRVRSLVPLGLGLAFCVLAVAVRHNGVAAVWPLLTLPLIQVKRLANRSRPLRLLASLAAALASAVVLSVLVTRALAPWAIKTNFWQLIATFDIAGISINTGKVMFDPDSPVVAPGVTLEDLRRRYSAKDHMTLYKCGKPPCTPWISRSQDPAELAQLAKNWRRAVLSEPVAYLSHRAALYRYASGIVGGPKLNYESNTKYKTHYPPSRSARSAQQWLVSLRYSVWFKTWIYLALGIVAAPIAFAIALRGGPLLPLAMALSSVSYTASVFLGAGAPDYRYGVWTILAAVLALLALAQPQLFRKPLPATAAPSPESREPRPA